MRVLIVEDDNIAAAMLRECLIDFGFEVSVANNGEEALDLIRTGKYRLVVSDWEMPEMDGVELCRRIRQRQASEYVYIILLTSRGGTRNIVTGLDAGADDFLTKPFQPAELCVRLRAAERVIALESRDLVIFCMAKLAESRDTDTGHHLERIRNYSRLVADHLSKTDKYRDEIDGDYVQLIYATSPLHDIGKVGIPDKVLLKPGKLTPEEFEIMKQHTVIGAETLDATARVRPDATFLKMARDIAWYHHEKFDGSGYPHGLAGEHIPLCARIVALPDVYDALTTKRVYKPAYTHEHAREIIVAGRGRHFDPDAVDAFLALESEFQALHRQLSATTPTKMESEPEVDCELLEV